MTIILVIEDERTIRKNLARILEHQGFEVVQAENGKQGIQQAKAQLPDLIICDILMPEADGYTVLSQLRQDSETAMIPFIFLTAKADMSDLRQGMNLGADDYLFKPFTAADLTQAVQARLSKQAATTQPYINEMKRAAASLNQFAYQDPLTNLPNRVAFHQHLQEAIAHSPQGAVLQLDLTRFRDIHSQMGHAIGDLLLQAIAQRLNDWVGSQGIAARLSDEEFGVLLPQVANEVEAMDLAQQIVQNLTEPSYSLNGQLVSLQVSAGLALFPNHSRNPNQLISYADTARRWEPSRDSNAVRLYEPAMTLQVAERQALTEGLKGALERQEFQLRYQPQVNLITGRVIGVEVLVRWRHPQRGAVSPVTFIPIAEETGLIIPIGEWILKRACQELQSLQSESLTPLRVSVNLSARQFKHPNLVEVITRILDETQFDPNLLVIELTETSVMEDIDASIKILQALKSKGMQLSIDDFGTGYSSLNYLKRFPIDTLKIDRSFVSQVTENEHDAAIATAIIAMAQSLKLKTIAEGVETQAQLEFLRKHGCHATQGNLYSPPIAIQQLIKLLQEERQKLQASS